MGCTNESLGLGTGEVEGDREATGKDAGDAEVARGLTGAGTVARRGVDVESAVEGGTAVFFTMVGIDETGAVSWLIIDKG
jgi:hypothetical protein